MKYLTIHQFAKKNKPLKYNTVRAIIYNKIKYDKSLKEGVDYIREKKQVKVIKVRSDLEI